MSAATQDLLALGIVAAAALWILWRVLRPFGSPSTAGCARCDASADAPPLPPQAIRPRALRVLRDD